jgi:photosystem II stability/assembly factor-like uncharacterized protein
VEREWRWLGMSLLVLFTVLLGWFMNASLHRKEAPLPVKPLLLTPGSALYGVSFSHGQEGWAVGRFGLIIHSDDGGKTWKKQTSGTMLALSSVSAADPRQVFAVGTGGTILATRDGGQHWEKQASGTGQHLLEVQALTATEVYVVGGFGTMLTTMDGGRTWVQHSLPWDKLIPDLIQQNGPVSPNLNSVFFVSKQSGWVVGEFGLILHTDDGGQTWNLKRYGADLPQLSAVAFSDPLDGLVAGQNGTLLRTTDGGRHWTPVDLGTKRSFYAISVEERRGVVVGEGAVFLTEDGGATWRAMKPFPENVALSAVASFGSGAIAVGPAPIIAPIDFGNGS